MKNRTKAFLTILITYVSLCVVAWGSVAVSVFGGAGSALAIVVAAGVISIVCSIAGVKLGRQPKDVWISFSITTFLAWFTADLLNLITAPVPYSTTLTEVVNIGSLIFGFPGFIFGMVLGERYGISGVDFIGVLVYVLCGIIPSVVTTISGRIRDSKKK